MKTIFVTLLAFTLLLLSCIKDEKEDVINYIEENDKLPEFTVKSPGKNFIVTIYRETQPY